MVLNNIGGFNNILDYVKDKVKRYEKEDKNFKTFFSYMFSEEKNVFAEYSSGYKTKKITYGECKEKILKLTKSLKKSLITLEEGSLVGLDMKNSVDWVCFFWAILGCGFRPLLINSRLPKETIINAVKEAGVKAIISEYNDYPVNTLKSNAILARDDGDEQALGTFGDRVYFMSSGTMGSVKLCAYTAENFFYQVCDSVKILERCPQMGNHYDGQLKQLALLPFYHVFGFIAVYTWFAFFARTFVFIKDLNPKTILGKIKEHKITHIFAVPLVWETIRKKAIKKIREQGEKTFNKFNRALISAEKGGIIANLIVKHAFKKVRDQLFGESVQFIITGGSSIDRETARFFNNIGYYFANGYGMTEIGITSVETRNTRKDRNLGSVGNPFSMTEYSLSSDGHLLVKGKTRAHAIVSEKVVINTDYNEWFDTGDLAEFKDGGYYIVGRADDLIVCENGENVNPEMVEKYFNKVGAERVCLIKLDGVPTLVASVRNCYTAKDVKDIYQKLNEVLSQNNLSGEIKKIVIVDDDLMDKNDFKISRKKIALNLKDGKYNILDPFDEEGVEVKILSELENKVIDIFSETLSKDKSSINADTDFFADLGASSLDYFVLLDKLSQEFDLDVNTESLGATVTVKSVCRFISGEVKKK